MINALKLNLNFMERQQNSSSDSTEGWLELWKRRVLKSEERRRRMSRTISFGIAKQTNLVLRGLDDNDCYGESRGTRFGY